MATDGIILVHGGVHTATCWAPVIPLLDVPARAVDLPGRGSRPADLATVGLDDCVDAVMEEANAAGFDHFALVGHSLGGITITETGYRHGERITHLVFVAALIPPPGSSAASLMTGADLESAGFLSVGRGAYSLTEEFAKALFGNDLTEAQWTEHFKTLVPDAVGIRHTQLSGHPSGIPLAYVNMSADVPVPPAVAEQMVANLGSVVERRTIDAGHTVMVSQPNALADIINEAVAR